MTSGDATLSTLGSAVTARGDYPVKRQGITTVRVVEEAPPTPPPAAAVPPAEVPAPSPL